MPALSLDNAEPGGESNDAVVTARNQKATRIGDDDDDDDDGNDE